jgi:hypothetical protein
MRSGTLWGAALYCLAPTLTADHRLTATAERLWGMEHLIEAAIEEQQAPLKLLPAGERSDYRILLAPRFRTRSAFLLYRKVTGRSDDTSLELYDPRKGEVLARLYFRMDADETARKRAAREFVRRVKAEIQAP